MKYKLKTADFNLFLLPSDTEMTKFIGEVLNLGEIFPEIYGRIASGVSHFFSHFFVAPNGLFALSVSSALPKK